jgi:hypothetical protein
MTIPEAIVRLLLRNKGRSYCDNCLRDRLALPLRQEMHPFMLGVSTESGFIRECGPCSVCRRRKLVIRADRDIQPRIAAPPNIGDPPRWPLDPMVNSVPLP